VEPLHTVTQAAHEQADPDDAVQDDHQRGVDRVARQAGLLASAGEHHRENERGLDDGHRDRQHERAEGLADPVGDDLGVMHGRDHRADERTSAQQRHDGAGADDEGYDEQRDRDEGHCPRPRRHGAHSRGDRGQGRAAKVGLGSAAWRRNSRPG